MEICGLKSQRHILCQSSRSVEVHARGAGRTPEGSHHALFVYRERGRAFWTAQELLRKVSDIEVTPKNWDLTKHIQDIVKFAKERPNSFPFVFIDPKGWELLQIEILAPILSLNQVEVLITLMTSWITRFLNDKTKGFERLLGADLEQIRQLEGEEQEDEIVRSYANSVRQAGRFKYVCTLPVMKKDKDSFHFHMIYATRHDRGVEVFKETEKSVIPFMHETRAQAQQRRTFEQSGQTSLLPAEARYREKRFTRFQLRNVELAKRHLRERLESSREILFDDAWAIAMQYPAVLLSDLHDWLREWEAAELLEITNKIPRQKWPRKKHNQYLRWRQI